MGSRPILTPFLKTLSIFPYVLVAKKFHLAPYQSLQKIALNWVDTQFACKLALQENLEMNEAFLVQFSRMRLLDLACMK